MLRMRALTILDYGDRTETELRRRLQGDLELVSEVINELRTAHLVDDHRYTERAVERHLRGSWGKRKLSYQLQRCGIRDELLDTALDSIDEETELTTALSWARNKLRDHDPSDPVVLRRLYKGLLRRGFEHSVAQAAMRRLERDRNM